MSAVTTPFGFAGTAAEVAEGVDPTGRRAVVTGASSGLGAETARALATTGAAVALTVRDVAAGGASPGTSPRRPATRTCTSRIWLDLTDPGSVSAFTAAAWQGPLHVLVNNAGVMACPQQYTEQGWEWQFATNHLGHFALATGLHDAPATDGSARIVVVSSTGHQHSPVVWDDVHFAFPPTAHGSPTVSQDRQRPIRRGGPPAAEPVTTSPPTC
ncbi:SDR family NAD(P)-dependent oxidoreductase [Streptomyces sp. NPDC005728]|uniref:SDR family NAD(P)-dependent oxidoreductase n=1 Tax=Streptomyces sp. NPDC005728 TaxID=3157054 RepID=UPI0033FFCC03